MSTKDKSLETRRDELQAANEQRVAQVQQWNQQIAEVQNAIRKMKEDHDYTRGQIDVLTDLMGETIQAAPLETEATADDKDAEAPAKK